MNIALIGMMGTMKTSVGKALAKKTGMRFFDTDAEFVRREGRSISDAFAEDGEEYFREKEREIVGYAATLDNTVVSCGGGAPLARENAETLKRSCTVVLLTATAEKILERTSGSSRPLLQGGGIERIRTLLRERRDKYEAAADFTVDTTDILPETAADIIIRILHSRS